MSGVRIGLIQMTCSRSPEENLRKAMTRVREAAGQGCHVVCLQELFRSRYFCFEEAVEHFDLSQSIPDDDTRALAHLAENLGIHLIAPVFERRAPGVYHNSSLLFDSRSHMVGHYRKMHIPDDPGYYEKFYFTPGDLGFSSTPTEHGHLGMLICWDQWFPEAARLTCLKGAQILFYPTAIGWDQHESAENRTAQFQAWEIVQRGHAVANGVFVAVVNRVGREGRTHFWGRSFVADPFGRVIGRASPDQEEILVVDCPLAQIEEVRRHWPFLRDRRIDAYGALDLRWDDDSPPPGRSKP